jgi:hypothetical protein
MDSNGMDGRTRPESGVTMVGASDIWYSMVERLGEAIICLSLCLKRKREVTLL